MSSGAAQAIPPPLNNNASADSLHFAFLPTPLCDDLMFRYVRDGRNQCVRKPFFAVIERCAVDIR